MEQAIFLHQVSTRSQLIYSTILLSVLGAVAALPFLYVDVSMRAGGLVRPVAERSEVKAQLSGNVAVLHQTIRAGQSLPHL